MPYVCSQAGKTPWIACPFSVVSPVAISGDQGTDLADEGARASVPRETRGAERPL